MINPHTEFERLTDFVTAHPRLAIVTGAGISAASGIPTYRDCSGTWRHAAPITHGQFIADPAVRRRYWARSMQGWPVVRDARPNGAHRALAQLERAGHVELLITQNVDRLHQRAGSDQVLDLHGRVDRVRCLACEAGFCRERIQQQLLLANAGTENKTSATRPDGDADIPDAVVARFRAPSCPLCGGTLMPDVVLFGGSVPAARVSQCNRAVERADALLAIGSSLQVYSGFRFCRLAAKLDKPIAIINPGITRADSLAQLKCFTDCATLLGALAAARSGRVIPSGPAHVSSP